MDRRALNALIIEYTLALNNIETDMRAITDRLYEVRTTNRIAENARNELRGLQGRLEAALRRTHDILNGRSWWRMLGRRVLTTMFSLRTQLEPGESAISLRNEEQEIMQRFHLRSAEEMSRQRNLTTNSHHWAPVAPDATEHAFPDPPQQTSQQGFNAGGTWGGFNTHIHPSLRTVGGSSSETLVGANTLREGRASTSTGRGSIETTSTDTADLEDGDSSS